MRGHPVIGAVPGLARAGEPRFRLESGPREKAQPHITAERAQPVGLADHLDRAVRLPQGEFVLHPDPVIVRIGIPGPLAEAALAAAGVALPPPPVKARNVSAV